MCKPPGFSIIVLYEHTTTILKDCRILDNIKYVHISTIIISTFSLQQ